MMTSFFLVDARPADGGILSSNRRRWVLRLGTPLCPAVRFIFRVDVSGVLLTGNSACYVALGSVFFFIETARAVRVRPANYFTRPFVFFFPFLRNGRYRYKKQGTKRFFSRLGFMRRVVRR